MTSVFLRWKLKQPRKHEKQKQNTVSKIMKTINTKYICQSKLLIVVEVLRWKIKQNGISKIVKTKKNIRKSVLGLKLKWRVKV